MRNLSFLTVVLLMGGTVLQAQRPVKVEQTKPDLFPEWITFAENDAPAYKPNQVWLIDPQGRPSWSSSVRLITKEKDQIGFEHHRLQQVYNTIPVEHAIYIAHVKNGKLVMQNGKWVKDFPANLPVKPSLTESAALSFAKQYMGAKIYKWEDPAEEAFLRNEQNDPRATFKPKGALVYYSGQQEVTGPALRLAYKFDLYAADPVSRKIIYVDALDGRILGYNDLIHESDVTGTAVTAYSGTKSITTDQQSSNSFRLRESGGGRVIETFNLQKKTFYSSAVDFTDADNTWNNVNKSKDQYATDAHWGAEKTFDFYKTNFSRNSIDDNNFPLRSYVHYSSNYFNAFWDGSRMTYGDGNSTDGFKPLTAIDVCGHEITHGLTSFTANLNYSYESGAMNEGFSDIFGTAIEKYARPTQNDWLIGGDFYTIRNMSNPNQYSDPDTYQGTYWYGGSSDNGGVHTNSGVLNFWFYLLTTGGTGTNDKGYSYTVTGLTIAKAQAIAFRTLTVYLSPTSNYADARTASIQAALDLYSTTESTQVTNAWNAVGVGGGTSARGIKPNQISASEYYIVQPVYPNPFDELLHINFQDPSGGNKVIELIDLSGRTILHRSFWMTKGLNEINLQTAGVRPGMYFIRINKQLIGSVVKQ